VLAIALSSLRDRRKSRPPADARGPAKDGHSLQEFDPRFLHGALQSRRDCDLALCLARLCGRQYEAEEAAKRRSA